MNKKIKIASWSNVLPTHSFMPAAVCVTPAVVRNLEKPFIARGSGRSFGDSAYISDGITLSALKTTRISDFDPEAGIIRCESGVRMVDLHNFIEKSEWHFPVYGGTQWVTMGGAVAADIHGKNDEAMGSFGNHILSMNIITPQGELIYCSPEENRALFITTVGGMGLTGFIQSVCLKLKKRKFNTLSVKTNSVRAFPEVLSCFDEAAADFKFCSWNAINGHFSEALFHQAEHVAGNSRVSRRTLNLPLPKINLVNSHSLRLANFMIKQFHRNAAKRVHIRDFNYVGLHERIRNWNAFFGTAGVIEFQFLVSATNLVPSLTELHSRCAKLKENVFNVVVKKHGRMARMGLLSFPGEGYSVNFQVRNLTKNREMLIDFTDQLISLNGRIYLTKDSCILPRQFEKMYPQIDQWRSYVKEIDPNNKVQSNLSNRLKIKPW